MMQTFCHFEYMQPHSSPRKWIHLLDRPQSDHLVRYILILVRFPIPKSFYILFLFFFFFFFLLSSVKAIVGYHLHDSICNPHDSMSR